LIIAHRLSTLRNCDRIVEVASGGLQARSTDKSSPNIDLRYVEVPHQLLPAARVVQGANGYNISFK